MDQCTTFYKDGYEYSISQRRVMINEAAGACAFQKKEIAPFNTNCVSAYRKNKLKCPKKSYLVFFANKNTTNTVLVQMYSYQLVTSNTFLTKPYPVLCRKAKRPTAFNLFTQPPKSQAPTSTTKPFNSNIVMYIIAVLFVAALFVCANYENITVSLKVCRLQKKNANLDSKCS